MKILAIHSDYLSFEPMKKAIPSADDVSTEKVRIEECLVVFTSVESTDEEKVDAAAEKLVEEAKKIADQVKTRKIVLYPYAHLSSKLAKPAAAVGVLKKAEEMLKNEGYEATGVPFGWYKAFEIKCKGHPLSELSREFTAETKKIEKAKDEKFIKSKQSLTDAEKANLSASILVAKAVLELFPESSIGSTGFYNDTAYTDIANVKIRNDDFPRIEKKAKEIIGRGLKFEKISKDDAADANRFQKEILADTESDEIYKFGDLITVSLYNEPFLASAGKVQAFKIINIASAYWKNNSKNEQLVRIYSAGFKSKEEFESYQKKMLEAEKRDHRNLGKELDLFMVHEYAPGMPFFLPKGMTMLIELTKFVREVSYGEGYKEVRTPQIFNADLWKTSGHWGHYRENMFTMHHAEDKMDMAIKPMNCPAHHLIFKRDSHSYKDLPLRIAETSTLYRNEASGTLTGLTRVRSLSQDDTHIFLAEEQIFDEMKILLQKVKDIYRIFNLEIDEIHLSTRPDQFLGKKETWDFAEENLKRALDDSGLKYKINEGDGAFYGPKIDVKVKDALSRQWQLATIQLDYQLPQKFELHYIDHNGEKKTPVVIHRAILGSMERFLGIAIEHFSGKFPLWLSPVQVKVVTVADRHIEAAQKIASELKSNGIRVEVDERTETIGKKVREAQMQKINYVVTVGDKEIEQNTLAIRSRAGQVRFGVKTNEFISELLDEVNNKEIK